MYVLEFREQQSVYLCYPYVKQTINDIEIMKEGTKKNFPAACQKVKLRLEIKNARSGQKLIIEIDKILFV